MFERTIRAFRGLTQISGDRWHREFPADATIVRRRDGRLLTFLNASGEDIRLDLGGLSWSIPRDARRTFGPFPSGLLDLAIWAIKDSRPDRLLSTTTLTIEPSRTRRPNWLGLDERAEKSAWEWDGAWLRPIEPSAPRS